MSTIVAICHFPEDKRARPVGSPTIVLASDGRLTGDHGEILSDTATKWKFNADRTIAIGEVGVGCRDVVRDTLDEVDMNGGVDENDLREVADLLGANIKISGFQPGPTVHEEGGWPIYHGSWVVAVKGQGIGVLYGDLQFQDCTADGIACIGSGGRVAHAAALAMLDGPHGNLAERMPYVARQSVNIASRLDSKTGGLVDVKILSSDGQGVEVGES